MREYESWEQIYRKHDPESLPWELGEPRPVLVDLIQSTKVAPAGKALDLCRGLGTNTIYLARAGFQTTGIDISETAVVQARRKAREAGVDIRFWVGSALHLPFERDEFDFIFDMGCFHHMKPPDRDRFIGAILRVLKDDGHYFMVCFSDKNGAAWNHFSDEEILDIFSPHFEAIEMQDFSPLEGDSRIRFFYATLFRGPIDARSSTARDDRLLVSPNRQLMLMGTRHPLACITYASRTTGHRHKARWPSKLLFRAKALSRIRSLGSRDCRMNSRDLN